MGFLKCLEVFKGGSNLFRIALSEGNEFGHGIAMLRNHEAFTLPNSFQQLRKMCFRLRNADFRHVWILTPSTLVTILDRDLTSMPLSNDVDN